MLLIVELQEKLYTYIIHPQWVKYYEIRTFINTSLTSTIFWMLNCLQTYLVHLKSLSTLNLGYKTSNLSKYCLICVNQIVKKHSGKYLVSLAVRLTETCEKLQQLCNLLNSLT